MSLDDIDPDILSEFITESNELIDSMDQDLVRLESEPENLDIMNGIFRALHTIKGSGSFLALDTLTEFAHAAEDALNELRKGNVKVTTDVMDVLLEAADITRGQIEELSSGVMPSAGPEELKMRLIQVRDGKLGQALESSEVDQSENTEEPTAEADTSSGLPKLELDSSKMDLLPFMVEDLKESIEKINDLVPKMVDPELTASIAAQMFEITDDMIRTSDFFEIKDLLDIIRTTNKFCKTCSEADLAPAVIQQSMPRILAVMHLTDLWCQGLENEELILVEQSTFLERFETLAKGETLDPDAIIPEDAAPEEVFQHDGVKVDTTGEGTDEKPAEDAAPVAVEQVTNTQKAPAAPKLKASASSGAGAKSVPQGEQTIRVDVERLEALLNLVGELVLQKNRVLAMVKGLANVDLDQDKTEEYGQIASDLDRVTGDLQMGVMKTRLQPLSKLFSRYPRVIRDLSRATQKEIDLIIEGGETEVDKSVLEGLGDPLVHILRNSCDHGIETPDVREAAGKPRNGTLTLSAAHEGSHVQIRIVDDGNGIDPSRVGPKAVEKGVVSQEELDGMTDHQIIQLIFAPGFSTAAKVSDLSGRGVGMDVVRSNIVKLNGMIDLQSEVGMGTSLTIKIPLTVAIMQAMMVDVADELYAVPLSNILEIVQPEEEEISTISGSRVMRLRDQVVPLIDLRDVFDCPKDIESRFAVIVGLGEQKVGLMVSKLIGQQEVVIKPLDDIFDQGKCVSGATVNEDGTVSLILDIAALLELINQEVLQ